MDLCRFQLLLGDMDFCMKVLVIILYIIYVYSFGFNT